TTLRPHRVDAGTDRSVTGPASGSGLSHSSQPPAGTRAAGVASATSAPQVRPPSVLMLPATSSVDGPRISIPKPGPLGCGVCRAVQVRPPSSEPISRPAHSGHSHRPAYRWVASPAFAQWSAPAGKGTRPLGTTGGGTATCRDRPT